MTPICTVKKGTEKCQLDHLNNIRNSIKFSMEKKEDVRCFYQRVEW